MSALTVSAQPPGETDEAAAEPPAEYRELVRSGLAEFRAGRWPEARALLYRAHRLFPNARTLRGLGRVDFELRDYPSAIRHLQAALDDPRRPLTEEMRSEVGELLERARAFVGRFRFDALPEGSQLFLDGQPTTPGDDGVLVLGLGTHRIEVLSPTGRYERRVTVRGGEEEVLPLILEAPAVETPEARAPEDPPVLDPPVSAAPPTGPRAGGLGLLLGGAGLTVVGAIVLGFGIADYVSIQNAQEETAGDWSDARGAFDRAPILTGLGIAGVSLGAAAMLGGGIWLAVGGGAGEAQAGLQLRLGGRL